MARGAVLDPSGAPFVRDAPPACLPVAGREAPRERPGAAWLLRGYWACAAATAAPSRGRGPALLTKGWSFLQAFRSWASRLSAMPDILGSFCKRAAPPSARPSSLAGLAGWLARPSPTTTTGPGPGRGGRPPPPPPAGRRPDLGGCARPLRPRDCSPPPPSRVSPSAVGDRRASPRARRSQRRRRQLVTRMFPTCRLLPLPSPPLLSPAQTFPRRKHSASTPPGPRRDP